ncbi:hypothetical protein [Marinifilum flexuosum]|uniref:hypothetical protein n=1 Tax=Marinifilum flexuosum TaxID=1117708 RepID=UPI002493E1FA|nr:hypothetical protein [Marinifilum flexuosum]
MKSLILILLSLSFLTSCTNKKSKKNHHRVVESYVQLEGKQVLSENESVSIPLSKQGYTLHLPDSSSVATLVFFSGSALDTTAIIPEFSIIEPALKKQMAVIFVSTGKPIDFFFTDKDISIADKILGHALNKHKLSDKPVFLGGMSLAGTMALRYCEYCFSNKSEFNIWPKAVAICDSPLDMVRMWHEQEQALLNNFHPNAVGEARWVLHFLKENLGGSPKEAMESYIEYSPFVYNDKNRTKIELFKKLAIRIYHEPDIEWWIKNRAKDYNTINSIDLAGFYNHLRQAGNMEAELITTYNKREGYEKNSSPHTWTIVDNADLINWYLEKMKTSMSK